MKSLSYFNEQQQKWLTENDVTPDQIRACVGATSDSNTTVSISTDTGVLRIRGGNQHRYWVSLWFKPLGIEAVDKTIVDSQQEASQTTISFPSDEGEARHIRSYETVTFEVAAHVAVHYWITGELPINVKWIEKPTLPFHRRKS